MDCDAPIMKQKVAMKVNLVVNGVKIVTKPKAAQQPAMVRYMFTNLSRRPTNGEE